MEAPTIPPMDEIRQKLKELLIQEARLKGIRMEDISEDAHLMEDLGLDSTDVVALIFGVEEAFNISINDEDVAGCTTLRLMAEAVQQRIALSA